MTFSCELVSAETRLTEISPSEDKPPVIPNKIWLQLQDLGIELPSTSPTNTSNLPLKTEQPLVQAASGQVGPSPVSSRSNAIYTTNSGTQVVLLYPPREIEKDINHKPSTTGHAHTGHGHVKYHSTHADLQDEHENESTEQVIHRVTHGWHRHAHSDPIRHQQTHIDLPGEHGNLSPHAVVHRHVNQHDRHNTHVHLPGRHGNVSPFPVIHRHGNTRSQDVSTIRTPYDVSAHTRQEHGHTSTGETLHTPVTAVHPTYYSDSPIQTTVDTGNAHQYQSSFAARTLLPRVPPTFAEGGIPMPSEYLSTPPSSDIFTPSVPGGMVPADMGAGGRPFGPSGGFIAPYHMAFRPFRQFGPLAHLPPFLRRRIRFRRRMRRRRRLRRLQVMRSQCLCFQ